MLLGYWLGHRYIIIELVNRWSPNLHPYPHSSLPRMQHIGGGGAGGRKPSALKYYSSIMMKTIHVRIKVKHILNDLKQLLYYNQFQHKDTNESN